MTGTITGHVLITQQDNGRARFECHLRGFARAGPHGFHVHTKGDLRDGCTSACSHYNPTRATHGGALGLHRHRGDLGNLIASEDGTCTSVICADVTVDEIVGRMLLVHADADNLGALGTDSSLSTGDAGDRIACGVIGRLD